MGGKLFPITRRYEKEEYENVFPIIIKEVHDMLNTDVFHVFTYTDKSSFGDIDILVLNNGNLGNVKEKIKKKYKTSYVHSNSNVVSFVREDLQVDLILSPTRNWETSKVFFPNDPTGNLMGKVAHKFGLKYGFQGLVYPFRGEGGRQVKDIVVSTDNRKIFEFLGFDYNRYLKGFDTIEDTFKFITESLFFDPLMFQMENLSSIDRKRNKKRKTYQDFLEYVNQKDLKNKFNSTFSFDGRKKDEWIPNIDGAFPDVNIKSQIKELKLKDERTQLASTLFNGRIVMEKTGLQGKDLGELMGDFKKFKLRQESSESFTDAILNDNDIMETFNQFYHMWRFNNSNDN